jgi:hypothetical protein
MSYHIQPASADDAKEWRACIDRAFTDTVFASIMWPKDPAEKAEEYQAKRIEQIRKRLSEPDGMFFKTVSAEQPGVIVGYTGLFGPGHFGKKATTSVEKQLPADPELHDVVKVTPAEPPPAWVNAEAFAEFSRKQEEARNEVWGEDSNYWCQWRSACAHAS